MKQNCEVLRFWEYLGLRGCSLNDFLLYSSWLVLSIVYTLPGTNISVFPAGIFEKMIFLFHPGGWWLLLFWVFLTFALLTTFGYTLKPLYSKSLSWLFLMVHWQKSDLQEWIWQQYFMLRNISLFVDYVLFDYMFFTFGSVALFNVKKVTCHIAAILRCNLSPDISPWPAFLWTQRTNWSLRGGQQCAGGARGERGKRVNFTRPIEATWNPNGAPCFD